MGDKPTNASTHNNGGVQELINKHINNLDEKGKLQLPDDLSEVEKELIRQAKRTRDAQSALSKEREEKLKLEAAAKALEQQALKVDPAELLSPEELQELNDIKYRDPDAYRIKMNELEAKAQEERAKRVEELKTQAASKAMESSISQNRLAVLEEFRQANPDLQLTDEVLTNDVPPRFMNELNAGKYDYRTYLEKVTEYLTTHKVLPTPGTPEDKSLGDVAGGLTPGKDAAEKAGRKDYKKITF